ncbi:MAG: TonB family protein [Deltaproteobacteria bacterium]|jgi:protein TonB|nr:TonB family protein [Deltaproteobacteria bacterium]
MRGEGQALLRLAERPKDGFHRLSRQNIFLFLTLAAYLHLFAFVCLDRLGFNHLSPLNVPLPSPGIPLELILETPPDPSPPAPPEAIPPLAAPIPPPSALTQETPAGPPAAALPPVLSARGELSPELETGLKPEELLDPSDNLVKTFSLTGSSILDEGGGEALGGDNSVRLEESAPGAKNYDSQVRGAVARHWILPPSARSNFRPGRFSAAMTLSSQGEIVSIVVRESAGNTALDYAAMEALRGAAPYPPFSEELSHIRERTFLIHFDYRAVPKSAAPDPGRGED